MNNANQPMSLGDISSNNDNNNGIIFFIAVIGVIVIISFISIIWRRMRLGDHLGRSWRREGNHDHDQNSTNAMENGVSEAILDEHYPKFLCSEAHKVVYGDKVGVSTTSSCCSICLGEYKDADMLRLLQVCGHLFHQKCIDPWLLVHPTCPVCRSYSVPNTPQR